jgi:hypothetical protein
LIHSVKFKSQITERFNGSLHFLAPGKASFAQEKQNPVLENSITGEYDQSMLFSCTKMSQ